MEVRCTRNCEKKDKQGRADALQRQSQSKRLAAERLSEFRNMNRSERTMLLSMTRRAFRQLWSASQE